MGRSRADARFVDDPPRALTPDVLVTLRDLLRMERPPV
jgi:hypothetical protein